MQRNLEITLRRNEKSNIEPLYELYELDYDGFIKKNNECKELIEKIENFLKE
ncbi:hypothetical protein J6P59_04105 [bacterium]|nr:hypothetical protein [bacterium]MBO7044109.1 hypothetical protein [bacterium]